VMPWQRAQNGRIRPVPLSNIVFMGGWGQVELRAPVLPYRTLVGN
jgi:hypothetical protein